MITLGHFFENDIVSPIDGFPPGMKKLISCNPPPNSRPGLSVIGEAVVRSMLDLGMIVDLTHSTPDARTRVFDILSEVNGKREAKGKKKRPVVFSHVGVRGIFNAPMNPSDGEILNVKECNGVIGIIFMNYWLSGKEENDFLGLIGERDPGSEYIYRTVEHIHRVTGSYDNVAIGTDFDGFTDPPDDLQDISKFPVLRSFLLKKGLKQKDVNKIMGDNILRVLQDGWG